MPERFTFDEPNGDGDSAGSEGNEELYLDDVDEEEADVLVNDEEDIRMALLDIAEDQGGRFPMVEQWKDEPVPEVVAVTMGRAVHEVWQQAKEEVQCARTGFEGLFDTKKPSLEQQVDFYFGANSKLFRLLTDELRWSHEMFVLFLKTYCVQCAYKVSSVELYSSSGFIDTSGLMDKSTFHAMWGQLAQSNLPDDEKASPATRLTLWMKLEKAMNEQLRVSVVEPLVPADDRKRMERIKVVFDDNKMWFDARKQTDGLKIVQHVRDNRRGPVHHDAVASATGQLAGFRFERPGDTTTSVVPAIVKDQFVPAQGGDGLKLDFLEPYGDRAYTVKSLFYSVFVAGGAPANGTKQRSQDFPFVFGQKLRDVDKRTDVPVAGAKTMFVKSVDVFDRKVYAIGYRNGNGGVTLGITTEAQHVYSWDVTLKNPADRNWWKKLCNNDLDELNVWKRSFTPLDAERKTVVISDELAGLLAAQPIVPLTMGQSVDFAWWLCRMFASSSTTACNGFFVYDGSEEELHHNESWKIVKTFLSKAGKRSWNQESIALKKEEPIDEAVTDTSEVEGGDDDELAEVDRGRLLADDDYATRVADQLDGHADDGLEAAISIDDIRAIILEQGGKISQSESAQQAVQNDIKKFIKWLREHGLLRRLYFKKPVAELRHLAGRLSVQVPANTTTGSAIYKFLLEYLRDNPNAALPAQSAADAAATANLSKPELLLQASFASAYLKKQTGDSRAETRRGLALEQPLARRLLEDSNKGLTGGFKVHEIASVPLVQRTGLSHQSVIASTDFVASADTPTSAGIKELILIECKSRVKPNTAERQRKTSGLAKLRLSSSTGLDDSYNKYFAIDAEDETFPYFVDAPKEALQILHQAFTYDVEWVLLQIGDEFARIIAGIFVRFDFRLKAAWGRVLEDIYRLSFSFLYKNPCDPFSVSAEEKEILERVLPKVKAAGASLDFHSFDQMVRVWRTVRLVWPKPLPPISKLIPLIFSKWNAMKGGSDTITKLLWSAKGVAPSRSPQANSIARMFTLLFIHLHRQNHIATSKERMPYKSLLHFRNANNKRFSLHETLLHISRSLVEEITETETTDAETVVSDDEERIVTADNIVLHGRATRGSRPKLQVQVDLPVTGMTPKRSVRKQLTKLTNTSPSKLKGNQSLVVDRVRRCTGIPVWSECTRGQCIVCGSDTLWYCLGCHANVCSNNISDSKKEAAKHATFDCFEMDITIAPLAGSNATPKVLTGVANTCYFYHHRAAIFKSLRVANNS